MDQDYDAFMNANPFRDTLEEICKKLDAFIADYNSRTFEEGGLKIPKQEIKIVGQAALLLAELPFPVSGTMDVDVWNQIPYLVQKKLDGLLFEKKMYLDPDGPKAWMPPDTKFQPLFDFPRLQVWIADPESVLVSKAKFNRPKDKALIETYLRFYPQSKERILGR